MAKKDVHYVTLQLKVPSDESYGYAPPSEWDWPTLVGGEVEVTVVKEWRQP